MMRGKRGEVDPLGVFPIFGLLKFTNADLLFSYRISESAGIRNFSGLKEQVRTTLTEASDLPRPAHPLHEHGRQILRDVTVSFLFALHSGRQISRTRENWAGGYPH